MKRNSHKRTRPVPLRAAKRQSANSGALPHPDSELTADEANELARQLNELICHSSHVNAWAQVEHAATMREYDLLLSLYGPALHRFIALHSDDPSDGVSLPAARLWVEEQLPTLHIEDEALALRWCRQHSTISIDVTISLNGSFEHMLTHFMQRELPFYLGYDNVYSRSVNLRRLRYDWREMETDEVPDGCFLEEAPLRLFVSPHQPNREHGGDDDDA